MLCACGDHRPKAHMYFTGPPWGQQCVDCCVSEGLDLDALQTVEGWENDAGADSRRAGATDDPVDTRTTAKPRKRHQTREGD